MENNLVFALNMEILRTAYKHSISGTNVLDNGIVVAFNSVDKHDSNSTELYLNSLPTGFIVKRDMTSMEFIKVCGVKILSSLDDGVLRTFVDTTNAISKLGLEETDSTDVDELK